MIAPGLRRDLAQALRLVWLVVGVITGALAAAPFVLPSQWMLGLFPACPAKLAGSECVLCGMTTAFVQLGSLDWAAAAASHRWSILLYLCFVLNFCGALAYTIVRAKRHANT